MSSVENPPVGHRFRPTEEELVDHYLRMKLDGKTQIPVLIPELYIYAHDPPDLFSKYDELSDSPSDGQQWFFLCPQSNKDPNGRRFTTNRKTKLGYWKDTCKKRPVLAPDGKQIGTKRIFVYYEGRQRKGCNRKTDIVMHEYHLNSDVPASTISSPMAFVVCRIHRQKQSKKTSSANQVARQKQRKKTSSANQVTHETIVEASLEATIESENQNGSSNFDAPESSKSSAQQTQTDQESMLRWDEGGYNNLMNTNMPCSPGDVFYAMDLDDDNLINTNMPHPLSDGISSADLGYDNLWNFDEQ